MEEFWLLLSVPGEYVCARVYFCVKGVGVIVCLRYMNVSSLLCRSSSPPMQDDGQKVGLLPPSILSPISDPLISSSLRLSSSLPQSVSLQPPCPCLPLFYSPPHLSPHFSSPIFSPTSSDLFIPPLSSFPSISSLLPFHVQPIPHSVLALFISA